MPWDLPVGRSGGTLLPSVQILALLIRNVQLANTGRSKITIQNMRLAITILFSIYHDLRLTQQWTSLGRFQLLKRLGRG